MVISGTTFSARPPPPGNGLEYQPLAGRPLVHKHKTPARPQLGGLESYLNVVFSTLMRHFCQTVAPDYSGIESFASTASRNAEAEKRSA